MELVAVDVDELVEFWTLLDEDRELLVGKRGGSALAFAVLLKHYSRHGSFPRRADLPGSIVEFVARQLGVEPGQLESYSTTTEARYGPTPGPPVVPRCRVGCFAVQRHRRVSEVPRFSV